MLVWFQKIDHMSKKVRDAGRKKCTSAASSYRTYKRTSAIIWFAGIWKSGLRAKNKKKKERNNNLQYFSFALKIEANLIGLAGDE